MNVAEKVLVCTDPAVSYNLCPGGEGGWGYLNDGSAEHRERSRRAMIKTNTPEKGRRGGLGKIKKHGISKEWLAAGKTAFLGKRHSEEHKEKMRMIGKLKTGAKNPMFGKRHSEETRLKISHSMKMKREQTMRA